MGIEVTWDNDDQTIIRYHFGHTWTWQDFGSARKQSGPMFASVDHVVDFIADFSHSAPPPMGALNTFKNAYETKPPNLGVIVIVGGSFVIKTLLITFRHLYRALVPALLDAETLEEARAMIAAAREHSR